jgi:endonuclease/exonuclease/phosphatase (EEP) superfamily protein YafD
MIAWLRLLAGLGLVFGAVLTGLGWLAQWWPALDLINNGLPLLAAGTVVLFGLALLVRDWRFIVPAALLAAINVGLIFAGLQGAAAEAAPDSKRFLRVVTFNLSFGNDRIDGVDKFLNETDADVVVLQEVTRDHLLPLHTGLDARYPHSRGEFGVVIFSKYPIRADGRLDRPGYPEWIRLMSRWVEIDVNGTAVELVGVHLARPFYPVLHEHDVTTLTQFVLTRKLPVIVAGDFNMTPWTDQLKRFTYVSGLGRFNTFHFTWPMRWRDFDSCRWSQSTMCSPRLISPRSRQWAPRGSAPTTGRSSPISRLPRHPSLDGINCSRRSAESFWRQEDQL